MYFQEKAVFMIVLVMTCLHQRPALTVKFASLVTPSWIGITLVVTNVTFDVTLLLGAHC